MSGCQWSCMLPIIVAIIMESETKNTQDESNRFKLGNAVNSRRFRICRWQVLGHLKSRHAKNHNINEECRWCGYKNKLTHEEENKKWKNFG